ncbi:transcriptional regulator [Clostridium botulinum]|uniref:Transcriptional regulator n=1 Tax=Clostridium botulinum C/D str. DC5 TaxID=1443128 RepID=A0A0A0IE74_CLOBO|nr:transcription repressor NadR [Clostridium botulinum]KGM96995.1 transcriptional regulator [Clostridium botulinum D str. CCUG 7971]KGM99729.1 transcriptional regulator [Clostridium botulinum C/D str. DC5]KOC48937.1 transcriptional regulator [Clostridium botulinum]KOC53767.1 transcriptional regulator [Clostridium botulinum]KOC55487.1 transcriptional regulator [Clostridium botulinum]
MDSKQRREYIKEILNNSLEPKKGQEFASRLGVTRQIIVKDIAILRASGLNIIATPEGYIIPKNDKHLLEKIVAVCHGRDSIEEELQCIVKYGGIIKDVVVEHPLYGEIKSMIMVKTLYDVEKFIEKINNEKAEPLLSLTSGVHLHTIQCENEGIMKEIIKKLKNKGYLIEE